jgi:hypothetical protein
MQMLQLPNYRQTQTNIQTKNLSGSLSGEEIVIDLVQTGKFFQGQSNPMLLHLEEQEQAWYFCDEQNYFWPC